MVEATTAGYGAAEALQNAIDYVNSDLGSGPFENGQKEYLSSNLSECRELLFEFLGYMPQEKLEAARRRVEEGEKVGCILMKVFSLYQQKEVFALHTTSIMCFFLYRKCFESR